MNNLSPELSGTVIDHRKLEIHAVPGNLIRINLFPLYSYRSASMGLSLPAFRAGYKPAKRPTMVQMIIP
jgi:hypothetical protein